MFVCLVIETFQIHFAMMERPGTEHIASTLSISHAELSFFAVYLFCLAREVTA